MVVPFNQEEDPVGLVLSDFDGAMVVAAEGADEAFVSAHATSLAARLGHEVNSILAAYTTACQRVESCPEEHGWEIDGRIVAPALVDAYVRAQVFAQIVLRDLGHDVDAWDRALGEIYQEHYLKYQTVFRPEMMEVFRTLQDAGLPTHVVSNSDPEKIGKRIDVLGEKGAFLRTLVAGYAKKFVVTDAPAWLPQHTYFPGLRRKVHTRKGHYAAVVVELMKRYGLGWRQVIVIGDIAELDLAMPVEMGARGLLIRGPNTPRYELDWAEAHPRVQVIENLNDVLVALGLDR